MAQSSSELSKWHYTGKKKKPQRHLASIYHGGHFQIWHFGPLTALEPRKILQMPKLGLQQSNRSESPILFPDNLFLTQIIPEI